MDEIPATAPDPKGGTADAAKPKEEKAAVEHCFAQDLLVQDRGRRAVYLFALNCFCYVLCFVFVFLFVLNCLLWFVSVWFGLLFLVGLFCCVVLFCLLQAMVLSS